MNVKIYSAREEFLNVLFHAIGFLGAIVSTILLLIKAVNAHNYWAFFGFCLFGFGMLSVFGASSLYHYAKDPVKKAKLRYFDHAAIYILIAGTYSIFALTVMREVGFWGWGIFIAVWTFAALGIILNFRPMKRNNNIKTFFYLAMSWIIVVALYPLYKALDAQGSLSVLICFAVSALFYTGGAIMYAKAKREFVHAIWHLFVFIAAASFVVSAFLIKL